MQAGIKSIGVQRTINITYSCITLHIISPVSFTLLSYLARILVRTFFKLSSPPSASSLAIPGGQNGRVIADMHPANLCSNLLCTSIAQTLEVRTPSACVESQQIFYSIFAGHMGESFWSERSACAALGFWHKRRWPLF